MRIIHILAVPLSLVCLSVAPSVSESRNDECVLILENNFAIVGVGSFVCAGY